MLFIDAERVHALLDYPSLVEAFQQYHREGVDALDDLLLTQPGQTDKPTHFFIRAAWQRQQAVGAKVITVFPDNETSGSGLPSVQAVYLLFDGKNGKPTAGIDGTAITYRKTAADSALGAKFLAREDSQTMLMVGAGAMAPHLIMAHRAIRPSIQKVFIWNRTPARAQRLADTLTLEGVDVTATADLEATARAADLISCATMSPTPLIKGEWLKSGTHLDLVGAFTTEMREADDEAVRRSKIYVDSRATTIGHIGEISIPIAAGVITEDDIQADFFDLCGGQHLGRESPDDITFFKNGGGGHLDLMTARFLLTRATEH